LRGTPPIPRPPFIPRPPVQTGPRTNEQIRAAQVRVLDAEGQQIGVMPLEEAIRKAEEAGLDLVEVAASADPPVCRIADVGRFKFEQEKRARDAKKNQHISEVKEVRLRPRTDDHDLQVRVRAARKFLEQGHKVKVEVRFRGREATHPEVAREQIGRIAAGVSDIAFVERVPSLEGRSMFAILARGKAPGSDRAAPRPAVGAATGGHAAPTPSAQPVAPVAPVAPPTPDAAPAEAASQAPAASSPGTN
jgi:translation initiation factor IF-3